MVVKKTNKCPVTDSNVIARTKALEKTNAAKKDLETLNASTKNENFSPLEQALFHSVISTLKLNRATWMLQSNRDEDIGPMLDTLLSNEMTPMLMMQTVRYFVLEYDLALPSLVNWYQTFDVTSPWHAIARAAVSASRSEERNAARDYQKAGESETFSYEEKIMIYRKAMIHYAHAGLWTESLNLIEKEPALKSALTKRFQLYLQVSFHASNQDTEKARKLLVSFIETKKMVEDEFGESKEKSSYANDDLDMLQDYPTSQPRPLPIQPFVGRVIAAKSWLKKQLYRGRKDTEYRYSESACCQYNPAVHAVHRSDATYATRSRGRLSCNGDHARRDQVTHVVAAP